MDPHLQWLRRLVIARAAERLAIEAGIIGLVAAVAMAAAGWPLVEVLILTPLAMIAVVVVRLGLAITTNPINHRYLLQWTDPSGRLLVTDRSSPLTEDDQLGAELEAGGFRFLARLERSDSKSENENGNDNDNDGIDDSPGLDLFRVDGGRLVVSRTDDGEISAVSRLDDGRLLATSAGLIPPIDRLVVQRAGGERGQIPTDAVIAHVERLLALRAAGTEAVTTDVDDVIDLARAEWEAWQQLGPLVGPLVAVQAPRRTRLALLIDVPDRLVRERTADAAATAARIRSRPAAG